MCASARTRSSCRTSKVSQGPPPRSPLRHPRQEPDASGLRCGPRLLNPILPPLLEPGAQLRDPDRGPARAASGEEPLGRQRAPWGTKGAIPKAGARRQPLPREGHRVWSCGVAGAQTPRAPALPPASWACFQEQTPAFHDAQSSPAPLPPAPVGSRLPLTSGPGLSTRSSLVLGPDGQSARIPRAAAPSRGPPSGALRQRGP